jgi:hypothetical protein
MARTQESTVQDANPTLGWIRSYFWRQGGLEQVDSFLEFVDESRARQSHFACMTL